MFPRGHDGDENHHHYIVARFSAPFLCVCVNIDLAWWVCECFWAHVCVLAQSLVISFFFLFLEMNLRYVLFFCFWVMAGFEASEMTVM